MRTMRARRSVNHGSMPVRFDSSSGVTPMTQRGEERPQPLVGRLDRQLERLDVRPLRVFPEDRAVADLERADGLLEGCLEAAVDRHHLAGRLHLRAEAAVAEGELVERPARDLDDAVVERRLEGGAGLPVTGFLISSRRLPSAIFAAMRAIG